MRLLLAIVLLISAACLAAAEPHRYVVRVDDALNRLSVSACVSGKPSALASGSRDAAQFLERAVARPSGQRLTASGGRLPLPGDARCVDYTVNLAAAAGDNRRYQAIDSSNRAVAAPLWLWLPRGQGAVATEVRFDLPSGMAVSVPWQSLDAPNTYTIPPSPRSDDAVSAFGRFASCTLRAHGTALRIAALHGTVPGAPPTLYRWIERAAANVALTYGRFPNPSPQIVLIPTARSRGDRGEPVPFGHVIRNGGEAVQFFVNQQQSLDAFVGDWTATHEFAHLLIPYIDPDEKWISEGLASYYQNVLMARGGMYTAEKAWRKIIEGFRRGEDSVPHLSLENAMPLGSWDGIMKTYWGGAAIFLMADVALRDASDNAQSLDTVLSALQRCCLPSSRRWDGASFFSKLDALAGAAVFMPLYERYRGQKAFPAYADLLEQLGLSYQFKRARLAQDAPLTAVRDAIMASRGRVPEAPLDCQ